MSDIKVSVTFRHTQPTAALKLYVEQKIHRIGKYFSHPLDARVILAVDSKECQIAEVDLHTHGTMIHGKEQQIQRQIKKQKEKTKLARRRSQA